MTIYCSDNVYNISYTDSTKGSLQVLKKALVADVLDIALVGKNRLEYGEIFNENVLHLLENFAAPENPSIKNIPDISKTTGTLLQHPTNGQTWYNTTQKRFFVYDNVRGWLPLGTNDDVGGNRGVIAHGMQLPLPVSPVTLTQFTYDECSWNVSPFNIPGEIDYMECYTDSTSRVVMRYKLVGDPTLRTGYVNYQIIAIKDNNNNGTNVPAPSASAIPPPPTPTPTPAIDYYVYSVYPSDATFSVAPPPSEELFGAEPPPGPSVYFGKLIFGQAGPSSYTDLASNTDITDYIKGDISTDGNKLFVPFYNNGMEVFERNDTSLVSLGTLSLAYPSGYVVDTLWQSTNATTGEGVLHVLSIDSSSSPYYAYITSFVTAPDAMPVFHSSQSFTFSGYSGEFLGGMCDHNGNIIVVVPPGILKAYHFDESTGLTFLNQYVSSTLTGNFYDVKSDNEYIYIVAKYSSLISRPVNYVFTFNGASFSSYYAGSCDMGVLTGENGDLFLGYNFQSFINLTKWNGSSFDTTTASIPSELPATRQLFDYSSATNRFYHPSDTAGISKIYSLFGGDLNELMEFTPNTDSGYRYTYFGLMYIADKGT